MKILQDTKEKMPWDLSFFGIEQTLVHVETGDYVIPGFLVIERKRSTGELSLNLGQKSRCFRAELERMVTFKYRCIICEFSIDDLYSFPINSGIPKRYWKRIRIS